MDKIKSMLFIENIGLPICEYCITRDKDMMRLWAENKQFLFSIRTQLVCGSRKYLTPFYLIEKREDFIEDILNLVDSYYVILTDGRRWDKFLDFNARLLILSNGNFIFEFCRDNVPLRQIDNCKIDFISGSVLDKWYTYSNSNIHTFEAMFVNELIASLLHLANHNTVTFELSKYTTKVNKNKLFSDVFFWQVIYS